MVGVEAKVVESGRERERGSKLIMHTFLATRAMVVPREGGSKMQFVPAILHLTVQLSKLVNFSCVDDFLETFDL